MVCTSHAIHGHLEHMSSSLPPHTSPTMCKWHHIRNTTNPVLEIIGNWIVEQQSKVKLEGEILIIRHIILYLKATWEIGGGKASPWAGKRWSWEITGAVLSHEHSSHHCQASVYPQEHGDNCMYTIFGTIRSYTERMHSTKQYKPFWLGLWGGGGGG